MNRSGDRVIARDRVIGKSLVHFWGLFISTLREIFDEAAYDRFLRRANVARSVSSYRAFLREREAGISRNARCC